jgi:predicted flap endonuclease-1-like 5' DNA nuclease
MSTSSIVTQGGGAAVGRFLDKEAPQKAVDLYLEGLTNVERKRLQPEYVEKLTAKARAIGSLLENLLSQFQVLAGANDEQRVLLYGLLKQLPIVRFEPLNYAFVGRVVIPLENVIDLLINFDTYSSGKPVRKGETPGTVELMSTSEGGKPEPKSAPSVVDIAGIGPAYSAILREQANIRAIQDLLDKGSSPDKRAALAEQTGLSEKLLARWVRRADLMRIDGVGEEYGELLDCGGVESVADLANRNADALYDKLRMANATRRLVQRLPSTDEIKDWIAQAKDMA